jgi:hypothetical protein
MQLHAASSATVPSQHEQAGAALRDAPMLTKVVMPTIELYLSGYFFLRNQPHSLAPPNIW